MDSSRPLSSRRPPLGSLAVVIAASLWPASAPAGDLVRGVRMKLSAADLASGQAAVEAYR